MLHQTLQGCRSGRPAAPRARRSMRPYAPFFTRARAVGLAVLAVLATGGAGALQAQTGTLTGTVVRDDGAAVSDASLHLVGLARTALSGADGHFALSGVPVGQHTIVVDRLGHATTRTEVEITEGRTTTVRIVLSERALDVVGILVTADRAARSRLRSS